MPGGIEITTNKEPKRHYFPVPHTTLPILKKDGALVFLPWGRRNEEEGLLPPGGWARLTSIKQGTWARFHPQPVKIPATGWVEKDGEGQSHYFPLNDDECIQGLVARIGPEERVYIVTIGASETLAIHPRAPRIIHQVKPSVLCRVVKGTIAEEAPVLPAQPMQSNTTPPPIEKVTATPLNAVKTTATIVPAWLARLPKQQQALWECLSTLGSISHDAILAEQHLRTLRQGNDE